MSEVTVTLPGWMLLSLFVLTVVTTIFLPAAAYSSNPHATTRSLVPFMGMWLLITSLATVAAMTGGW